MHFFHTIVKSPSSFLQRKTRELDIYWIVGFIEGDGCITYTLSKSGPDLRLIVVQADPRVLLKQQAYFGFGSVYKQKQQNKVYWRWVVRAKNDQKTIISVQNGKLFQQKRIIQFEKWVEAYNTHYKTNIGITTIPANFSMNNRWLCGFADTEGSFHQQQQRRTDNNNYRLRVRFYLEQTNAHTCQLKIKEVLGGTVNKTRLMVDTWNKTEGIIEYFNTYKPQTRTQYIRFIRYQRVYFWYVNNEWKSRIDQIQKLIQQNTQQKKMKF